MIFIFVKAVLRSLLAVTFPLPALFLLATVTCNSRSAAKSHFTSKESCFNVQNASGQSDPHATQALNIQTQLGSQRKKLHLQTPVRCSAPVGPGQMKDNDRDCIYYIRYV